MAFEQGQAIMVREGVMDEETGVSLAGWTGKITAFEEDLLLIEWDDATVANMPPGVGRSGFCAPKAGGGRLWRDCAALGAPTSSGAAQICQSSPHILRLTKTQAAYEKALKHWKEDVRLKETVEGAREVGNDVGAEH